MLKGVQVGQRRVGEDEDEARESNPNRACATTLRRRSTRSAFLRHLHTASPHDHSLSRNHLQVASSPRRADQLLLRCWESHDCQYIPTMSTQPTQKVHLLVLIHGMWGSPSNLASMHRIIEQSRENHLPDETELHVMLAETNQDESTYDGIDWGGERVASEVSGGRIITPRPRWLT
jgi:hypothetical protein